MAVHINDDYEKLAKLFYPSIEASGNVYYGQTRKLTMDEVLGKNDFGFDAHIESFRVDDDEADYGFRYISCLCWKLGPLHDEIELKSEDGMFPLDGIYGYAKYRIIVSDATQQNITYAGNFNTYEKSIKLEYKEIIPLNEGKAPFGDDFYDGRNFYVQLDSPDLEKYLYIPITLEHDSIDGDDEDSPRPRPTPRTKYFYIKSLDYPINVSLNVEGNTGITPEETAIFEEFLQYSTDGSTWNPLPLGYLINLQVDQVVYFKSFDENIIKRDLSAVLNLNGFTFLPEEKYLHFTISGNGHAEVGGHLNSLLKYSSNGCYYGLFRDNTSIVSAENLVIENVNGASIGYCAEMFSGCTGLITPPEFIAEAARFSHRGMFRGCISLIRSPKITIRNALFGCLFETFSGCTSLNKVWCESVQFSNRDNDGHYIPKAFRPDDLKYAVGPFNTDDAEYLETLHQQFPQFRPAHYSAGGWLESVNANGTFYCGANIPSSIRPVIIVRPDRVEQEYEERWGDYVPDQWNFKIFDSREYFAVEEPVENNEPEVVETSDDFTLRYKKDYLITSGSASNTSYGRGDVTDKSTVFNMKAVNPIKDPDAPEMDTYCSDGSYNQDVWGYKCFNGPVSFRNGIYGEFGSLTTLSDLSNDNYEAPKGGIELRVPAVDKDGVNTNSSLKLFYHDYHIEGDEDRYQQTSSMLSASGYDRLASIEAFISDDQEGVRIIGHDCSIASDVTEISSHAYPSGLGRRGGISLVARDTDDNRISSIEVANNITTKGSIIPKENLTDDIGDNDHKFNNLYVNSIVTDSLSTGSAANLQSINVSGNSYLHNTNIAGNLTVAGRTTLSNDTIITGDLTVSGTVSADGFSQNFVEVHKLSIVNKLNEDTGNIELGELTCHGCIKTYNYIEPVAARKLIPTNDTKYVLLHGHENFNQHEIITHIINFLNDNPNDLGLDYNTITAILNAFTSSENNYNYIIPNSLPLSREAIIALTSTPLTDIGIEQCICSIEPDVAQTGYSCDCRIGVYDLSNSYNGYFNRIYTNKISSNDYETFEYTRDADSFIEFITQQATDNSNRNKYISIVAEETTGDTTQEDSKTSGTEYRFSSDSLYAIDRNNSSHASLGNGQHWWNNLYVNFNFSDAIYTCDIHNCSDDNTAINLYNSIIPARHDHNTSTIDLGSNNYKFDNLYLYDTLVTNKVTGVNLVEPYGEHSSIGTGDNPFDEIYAKHILEIDPTPYNYENTDRIFYLNGTILYVMISNNSSSEYTFYAGDTLQFHQFANYINHVRVGENDGTRCNLLEAAILRGGSDIALQNLPIVDYPNRGGGPMRKIHAGKLTLLQDVYLGPRQDGHPCCAWILVMVKSQISVDWSQS